MKNPLTNAKKYKGHAEHKGNTSAAGGPQNRKSRFRGRQLTAEGWVALWPVVFYGELERPLGENQPAVGGHHRLILARWRRPSRDFRVLGPGRPAPMYIGIQCKVQGHLQPEL